ncbi:MAG: acyltransferase [Chloroflexi bacterium]|nr:acyltransferase [Chloroflexota bacterium]
MNATLARLMRLPRTLPRVLSDRFIAPRLLRSSGVRAGPGVMMAGRPTLRVAPGSTITLGANVKLFSRATSNPLRIDAPCTFSTLKPGAKIVIGSDSALSGTVICCAESVVIGERVLVGSNCVLVDTDFHPLSPGARRRHPTEGAKSRPIVVEDDVFIGTQSIILKGTTLGRGCVVGAGAVVSGEFPPYSVIVGNPAQAIKTLSEEQT